MGIIFDFESSSRPSNNTCLYAGPLQYLPNPGSQALSNIVFRILTEYHSNCKVQDQKKTGLQLPKAVQSSNLLL